MVTSLFLLAYVAGPAEGCLCSPLDAQMRPVALCLSLGPAYAPGGDVPLCPVS